MVDKQYCMSSYLALRYIEKENVDFFEGLHHENFVLPPIEDCTPVRTAADIDHALREVFEQLHDRKLGIMLSGGMDSACLAAYMPGCDAYTFRFMDGQYQKEELARAEYYAERYGLKLHYVDISWDSIYPCIEPVVRSKNAPVHSIEPQIYCAANQAKADGIQRMIVGERSDVVFGGYDQLLSKDWSYEAFYERYLFTDPVKVLREPSDMHYLFDRYRGEECVDTLGFLNDVFSVESAGSYMNAFRTAGLPYTDPYANLRMQEPLDLTRVRSGESKYLIRELFSLKYPEIPVPNKVPMPRPVDQYFSDWTGPVRGEFLDNLDMAQFSGNQKWQIWCLEYFLNLFDNER